MGVDSFQLSRRPSLGIFLLAGTSFVVGGNEQGINSQLCHWRSSWHLPKRQQHLSQNANSCVIGALSAVDLTDVNRFLRTQVIDSLLRAREL
jgi:hypothetical protein